MGGKKLPVPPGKRPLVREGRLEVEATGRKISFPVVETSK